MNFGVEFGIGDRADLLQNTNSSTQENRVSTGKAQRDELADASDGRVFNQLKQLVDSEGANLAGTDWLGMLAAIGIVKGQPFNLDARAREILDREGTPLSGNSNYRLNLPPNLPAANFWSVTLYEAENASGLANGQPFPSLGSNNPVKNDDGSITLYFGPQVPASKEKNWIKTVPGKGWFVLLRLYGHEKPFFEKQWIPGDFQKLK